MRHLTYFVSDVHLGLRLPEAPERERRFVDFLRSIPPAETETLYLLGDIWDFWYEYKDVVPKGFSRVFSALTDLMDAGVKVVFIEGNHDQWTKGYFQELGMECPKEQPCFVEIAGKRFCIGHGDLLGNGNTKYKRIQWMFRHPVFRTMFSALHPRIAFSIGKGWSRQSRTSKPVPRYIFKGEDEPLFHWCRSCKEPVDFFIFGHLHCLVDMLVGDARLIVLSDWKEANWAVFDASTADLTICR